jgi:hypothetical protein
MMTLQPDNTLRPYCVTRPMWYMGRACAVGDVLRLPRSLAADLQAAGKVAPAPEPAPEPAESAAAQPAPAPRRKRAEAAS